MLLLYMWQRRQFSNLNSEKNHPGVNTRLAVNMRWLNFFSKFTLPFCRYGRKHKKSTLPRVKILHFSMKMAMIQNLSWSNEILIIFQISAVCRILKYLRKIFLFWQFPSFFFCQQHQNLIIFFLLWSLLKVVVSY